MSATNAEFVERNAEVSTAAIMEDITAPEEGIDMYSIFFGNEANLTEPFFYTDDFMNDFVGDISSQI